MHESRIKRECNLPLDQLKPKKKGFPDALFASKKKRRKGGKSRSLWGASPNLEGTTTPILLCVECACSALSTILDPQPRTQNQVMPLCLSPEQMCCPADEALPASSSSCHNGNVWMFPLTNEVLPLFENSVYSFSPLQFLGVGFWDTDKRECKVRFDLWERYSFGIYRECIARDLWR